MAINLSKLITGVYGEFRLNDLDGFPYILYMDNKARYDELETWYSGLALETVKRGRDDDTEDFPARVNPIQSAAQKHVSALFGEFGDGGDAPPVRFRVKSTDKEKRTRANHIEELLNQIFSENNAGPAMIENALVAQYLGGCVFKIAYDPDDPDLSTGLRLDPIYPAYFVGIPDGTNFWKLREAWIVQQITTEEALRYGVELPNAFAWYIEHWTPTHYEIQIDNVLIGYNGDNTIYEEEANNKFKLVPFVYIPHIRSKGFYGDSLVTPAVRGLIKELNKNLADAGDAVKNDANGYSVMSNVRGMPQVIEIADGLPVINLGMSSPSISNTTNSPLLEPLNRGQISQPMVDLVQKVNVMLNRELFTPDVAYGEFGGGSQRSSSSLYTMMWHLTSHAKLERVQWTAGLRTLAKMALHMLLAIGGHDVTPADLDFTITIQWSEHLPRDRAELIDELAVRSANSIGSLRHLLTLVGDIDNEDEMLEEIHDDMEFKSKAQAPPLPTPTAKQTAPSSRMPKPKA